MEGIIKKLIKYLPYLISIALFIMPFFWLGNGEMDLGGDSSRLYFYDPFNYLLNHSIYGLSPSNFGGENIGYYILPFNILLILLKFIFQSPTILISIINGINFSVAFLAVYLIIKELIKVSKLSNKERISEWSAITGGIFYTFSFNSIFGWDKVILTHNQYFLNPLMFLLLLLFITRNKFIYLLFALVITFIFSANFSFVAAPPFFAFYPFSLLFLLMFSKIILKKRIDWLKTFIFILLFIGLQSFHLLPQIYSIFSPGSVGNNNIFSSEGMIDRGLGYFSGVVTEIKLSTNLLNLPQMSTIFPIYIFSFVTISVILLGLWLTKNRIVLLISIFFLLTIFFVTANITSIGLLFYKSLFYIPGFSMFRNFFGQWAYAYRFYYTLLFSLSFVVVLNKLPLKKYYEFVFILISIVFVVNSFPLISGKSINPLLWQSNKLSIVTKFDKNFEESINFVRDLPEGKVLTLPLTDPGYQVIVGKNNGAYQGPSIVAYLAGKKDFAGLQELGSFGMALSSAIDTGNFDRASKILTILNIKYIYHNQDPLAYEKGFPEFPYQEVKKHFPSNQESYIKLIKNIKAKKIFSKGNYSIYKLIDSLPHIYSPMITEISNSDLNNTELFLDIYNLSENRFATLESGDKKLNNFDEFTLIEDRFLHKTDYPINTIYPFVKWSPSSIFYPIVLWREEDAVNRSKTPIDRIQKKTLSALKRISELEKWGDSFSINANSSRKNLSWIESFESYKSKIIEAYGLIIKSKLKDGTRIAELSFLRTTVEHNKEKIESIIADSKLSRKEKGDLHKKKDIIFDSIDKLIGKNKDGFYVYYINNENLLKSQYNLVVGNSMNSAAFDTLRINDDLFPISIAEEEPFIEIKNVNLRKGLNIAQLIPSDKKSPSDNILWYKAKDLKVLDNKGVENNLIFNKDTISYISNIKNWEINKRYEITFEYNTDSTPYETSLYLRDRSILNLKKAKHAAIFREKKNTNDWTKFRILVDAKNTGDPIFEIKSLVKLTNEKNLAIKNFKVREMPDPPAIFLGKKNVVSEEQTNNQSDKKINPEFFNANANLSYTKINPTFYKVRVTDISGPFSIVMLDGFNKGWVLKEDLKSQNPLKGKALTTKHTLAFGYANAWSIDKNRLDNRKELEFSLEFKTQKYFYYGLFISAITLIFLIIIIVKEIGLYKFIKNFF